MFDYCKNNCKREDCFAYAENMSHNCSALLWNNYSKDTIYHHDPDKCAFYKPAVENPQYKIDADCILYGSMKSH